MINYEFNLQETDRNYEKKVEDFDRSIIKEVESKSRRFGNAVNQMTSVMSVRK